MLMYCHGYVIVDSNKSRLCTMVSLIGQLICFTKVINISVLNQLFSNTFFNSFGYETKIRNGPIVLEVVGIQRGLFEEWLKYSLFKYSRHPTSFQGKVDNLVYYWENGRKQTFKYMTRNRI